MTALIKHNFTWSPRSARMLVWLLAGLIVSLGSAMGAEGKGPVGTSLLASNYLDSVNQNVVKEQTYIFKLVTGKKQPFARAIQAKTLKAADHAYDIQARFLTTAAVVKGDVLRVGFYARAVQPTQGESDATVGVVFERAAEPYTKALQTTIHAGKEWQRYDLPFTAGESRARGEAQLNFQFGYAPQVIEVGGIELVNYGQNVSLADLPRTKLEYRGHESNAPWRKQAEARIEKFRKGDLKVIVSDGRGQPLRDVKVSVQMKRQAFGFGSAVTARMITDNTSEDARKYREMILKLYNKVVFENDMKWPPWENEKNRAALFAAIQWLRDNGIDIRGHNLVWPSWQYLPSGAEKLKNDPAALRSLINRHITNEVSALRGQLIEWDVINEPYTNHQLMDVLGEQAMVEWFKLARENDPAPKLFLNDYSILTGGGRDRKHQDHFEKTIRYLINQGAPIDGIGMQGHFGGDLTPPDRLVRILDRFAATGKSIQVTEHDIDIQDEQLQADYTRDFMTVLFSHPAVVGVLTWGFWEGQHWRPQGAYFRKDWSVKPAGQAWMELVLNKWRTNVEGKTNGRGEFQIRGFLGDYEITVSNAKATRNVRATLTKDGQTVRMLIE